jgi:eukaryotic-like serine/threonine-protein kinase
VNAKDPGRRPEADLDGETLDRSDQKTLDRGDSRPRPGGQAPLLAPGQAFGSYRLVRVLGKGGFGQVWEAESLETGRRLALKVLTEAGALDDSARQRFQREGRLAAAVSHPRCVYVFAAEEVGGYPVISMELVAGGTLQDEVKRRGALPFREAVDRVLDVLEGLEAAHARGVVHRDVKPSNCFLDAAGRAKIGDFGLSRTLEVDTKLTTTGVFMGTPGYSSPEQVRAEPLDFRADLYSAGATLYTLLAGEAPFPGSQLGPVLARILSDAPRPLPRQAGVPAGLERAVQRLMAKERDRRYQSYEAARAALLPYSSQGLTVASLAKRFAATVVDNVILMPAAVGAMSVSQTTLFTPLFDFFYFFVLEGQWGSSLGKRLFGLRVVSAAGGEAGWGAVALRSAAYSVFTGLPVWPRLFLSGAAETAFAHSFWPLLAMAVSYLALAATMRRRNSFAGVHELASRTRVAALPDRVPVSAPRGAARSDGPAEGRARLGPFVVESVVWERDGESVALASDPVLARPVFVHRRRAGAAAPAVGILAESGPGRLEWLQGARGEGECWDAFEAPDGIRYLDWVRARGRLSWSEVAGVLESLLSELERRARAGDGRPLSLDHVWVDGLGQGRLLGFALRDPVAADAAEAFAPGEWREFLHQLSMAGLEGRLLRRAELAGQAPRVPLAERARSAVQAIAAPGAVRLEELRQALTASAAQPAEVNTGRRGAALAIAGTWAGFAAMVGVMTGLWGGPLVDVIAVRQSLKRLRQLPAASEERQAAERLLGHYFTRITRSPQEGRNPLFGPRNADRLLENMPPEERRLAEDAAARHGELPPRELASARSAAGLKAVSAAELGGMMAAGFALPGALAGMLLAVPTRGGLGLRLGGIAVQKIDGGRPSRLRCLWRGLLAWGPLIVPGVIAVATRRPSFWWIVGGWALLLGGGIYALARPARGLQDLLAGTHLVPR